MRYRHLLFLTVGLLLTSRGAAGGEAVTNEAVSLCDLAGCFGFPPPVLTNATLTLRSAYSTLVFHANSRKLLYNDVLIWLNGQTTETNGIWTIERADRENVFDACLRSPDVLREQGATLVVLDAGHGGDDPGAGTENEDASGSNLVEKAIVLDIAQRTAVILESADVAVKLTRNRDRFLTLDQRTRLARRWGADAFVSIHVNHASNSAAAGVETYVMPCAGYPSTASLNPDDTKYRGNAADAANTLLGLHLHRALIAGTSAADRGLKRARFEVLRSAHCPAALVECGFLSNPEERAKLATEAYRGQIAESIANGLLAYLIKVEASQILNRAP